MWLRVVLSKTLELKVGDQLSKNLPVNENALIYVFTEK